MNINDFKRLIRPVKNKIFLLLGRAVLKAIDNSEPTQKHQVVALADETISDIEKFQEYGFENYPFVESEDFIGFLNGNRDSGIVLVTHDSNYRPTDLAEGEVVLYTDEDTTPGDFRIHLKRNRILNILADKVTETLDTSKVVTVPSETNTNTTEHIIDSPKVALGGPAFAGLRALIDERALALINAHVHPAGTVPGNTGPPTTALTLANATTTKVKGI